MIITIYISLILFSLIIIGLGFWISNPTLEVMGFFFLFCLGLVMMSGSLQYKVGEDVVSNLTDPDIIDHSIVDVYDFFDSGNSGLILGLFSINHLFGMLISILGGFGISITFFNMRVRD